MTFITRYDQVSAGFFGLWKVVNPRSWTKTNTSTGLTVQVQLVEIQKQKRASSFHIYIHRIYPNLSSSDLINQPMSSCSCSSPLTSTVRAISAQWTSEYAWNSSSFYPRDDDLFGLVLLTGLRSRSSSGPRMPPPSTSPNDDRSRLLTVVNDPESNMHSHGLAIQLRIQSHHVVNHLFVCTGRIMGANVYLGYPVVLFCPTHLSISAREQTLRIPRVLNDARAETCPYWWAHRCCRDETGCTVRHGL